MNPYPVQAQPPAAMPSQDDRMMAVASHLSFFVGFWLVGPIVFYLIKRRESRFVAFHAMQALVAHVLSTALSVFGVVVFVVGVGVAGVAAQKQPAALLLVVVMSGIFVLFGLGVAIVNGLAAYKAWLGEMWSIPLAGAIARSVMGADKD